MKKKLLIVLLAIIAVVCCAVGFLGCDNSGVNGTYYLYENGRYDKSSYITLEGNKWKDDDEVSGKCSISGTSITLYVDFMGEQEEYCSGTVSDGVMTLKIMGATITYCKEGKAPSDSGNNNQSGEQPTTKYTVTFNANGGEFGNGQETYTQNNIAAGTILTAPTSPTRTNYTFAGWSKDKNGKTMWQFSTDKVTENITLYAVWTQQSATILSVDGATITGTEIFLPVEGTVSSVSLSSKVVCSSDSTWKLYYDKLGQTEIPTKIAASSSGELINGDNVFYVVVTSQDGTQVKVYTLTVHRRFRITVYYYDGEKLLNSDSTYTATKFDATYKPTIEGYTFNGWRYKNNTFTSGQFFDNATLYVNKTANKYTLTLDVADGNELTTNIKEVTYDSNYTLPIPTREHYSFSGWYVGNTKYTDEKGKSLEVCKFTKNTELKAIWTIDKFNVSASYNGSAGSVSGTGSKDYNSTVTLTATTKPGYTWVGWYDGKTELSKDKSYTFVMPAGNVTYTAKWTYYTVTAVANDADAGTVSEYNNKKVTVGTSTTLTAETNDGYTFVGWYDGETELTKDLSYTFDMPVENVTYTAKWIACPVTLEKTIDKGGNITIPNATVLGQPTTIKATTNDGYTFVGWYNGETKLTKELSYTFDMPAESIIYTAKWILCPTISSSNENMGTVSALPKKTVVGQEVAVTATSKGLGYNFVGWYKGKELLTEETTYIFNIPEESAEYIAKFELDSAMTNFNFNSTATSCTITGIKDKSVTEIVVPDYVTEIKNGAFSGCSKLESITLPFVGAKAGVKATDKYQYPFGYIFGESSYTDGYATKQYYYGSSTSNTTNTTYYIPLRLGSVTITGGDILYSAFYECKSLTSITIPDSVTSIGSGAFSNCSSLTSITIPDSVTSIGYDTFYNCSSLKSITIPDSVTSIGNYAFSNCSSLKSVTIGSGVKSIGSIAFSGCSSLTNIIIPDSVTSIGDQSFRFCSSLESVAIGNGVISIEGQAFGGCSSLTSITIPDSVTSIGYEAFHGCSKLTYNEYDNAYYLGNAINPYVALMETESTSITSCTIHEDTKIIYDYAFAGCSSIANIIIPDSVTSIGGSAFYGCSSIANIIIPDSVTSIGGSAFYGCSSLASITIPDSVTSIGEYAFKGCSSLENIYITDIVAWCNISGLDNLMAEGSSNKKLYLNNNLITDLVIPDSVTSIGDSAFEGCTSLTTVTISDSVTSIGSSAFRGCTSLTTVTIPDSVTSIEYDAFRWCHSLTSITIPDSVTSIGEYAFYGCSSLMIVYYKGTAGDWSKITIDSSNGYLTSATRYYYSEEEPTTSGNYWHYVDGEPVIWTK